MLLTLVAVGLGNRIILSKTSRVSILGLRLGLASSASWFSTSHQTLNSNTSYREIIYYPKGCRADWWSYKQRISADSGSQRINIRKYLIQGAMLLVSTYMYLHICINNKIILLSSIRRVIIIFIVIIRVRVNHQTWLSWLVIDVIWHQQSVNATNEVVALFTHI